MHERTILGTKAQGTQVAKMGCPSCDWFCSLELETILWPNISFGFGVRSVVQIMWDVGPTDKGLPFIQLPSRPSWDWIWDWLEWGGGGSPVSNVGTMIANLRAIGQIKYVVPTSTYFHRDEMTMGLEDTVVCVTVCCPNSQFKCCM